MALHALSTAAVIVREVFFQRLAGLPAIAHEKLVVAAEPIRQHLESVIVVSRPVMRSGDQCFATGLFERCREILLRSFDAMRQTRITKE